MAGQKHETMDESKKYEVLKPQSNFNSMRNHLGEIEFQKFQAKFFNRFYPTEREQNDIFRKED